MKQTNSGLKDEDQYAREKATELIAKLNLTPIGEVCLTEPDPIWQRLVDIGEPSVPSIISTLNRSLDGYRPLGRIGTKTAIDALVRKLKDIDWRKVESACYGLGSCLNPDVKDALPLLHELTDSSAGEIVNAAGKAWVRIKTRFQLWKEDIVKPGVPPYYLINAIRGSDFYDLHNEIVQALEQITGESFGYNPKKWYEWWQQKTIDNEKNSNSEKNTAWQAKCNSCGGPALSLEAFYNALEEAGARRGPQNRERRRKIYCFRPSSRNRASKKGTLQRYRAMLSKD